MKGSLKMDTVNTIISAIGSLGFPIVCCWFLWKYINETMKEFTKTMEENTKAFNRMCDRFDMWAVENKGEDDENRLH